MLSSTSVKSSLVYRSVNEKVFYQAEERMVDEIIECLLRKENILLCTPRKHIFPHLVMRALNMDETMGFQKRGNPSKRAEILVVTNRLEMLTFLDTCRVNAQRLFQVCSNIHQYIGYCDIGDAYYARVYWKHILYSFYKGKLPYDLPLHYIYPVASGYRTFNVHSRGYRNVLGRKDRQNPTFYVTENLNMLNEQGYSFDYIFVDCSYINKGLSNLPKGTLLFFDNFLDDRIPYLQQCNVQNYLVDSICLKNIKEIQHPKIPINALLRRASIHSLDVEYVKSGFEQEIERLTYLLDKLRNGKFSRYDTNVAAKLLYILIRLPISAGAYDLIASMQIYWDTVQGLLQELKDSESRYENDFFEEMLSLFEDILYKHSLDRFNPKGDELKAFVLNEVKQGKRVCVVSNSRKDQIALKEIISLSMGKTIDELDDCGLQFIVTKDIWDHNIIVQCDSLVMYSAINFRDIQSLCKVSYKKAKLFLYSVEINSIAIKLQTILENKNHARSHFIQESTQQESTDLYRYLFNRFNKFVRQKVIGLNGVAAELLEKSTTVSPAVYRGEKDYKGTNPVKATLVRFTDGSISFFKKNSAVYVLDNKNKRVRHKHFHEIGLKDTILFVDNDARKDLYSIFIQSVDAKDTSKQAYLYIKKWRELYEEKFMERRMDDDRLFRLMRDAGWNKTSKSVLRNWRVGYSYGPRDKEDIMLLGEVLGINSFIEDVHSYYNAMSKIRVERQQAARFLNRLIYSSNQVLDKEDEDILTRYNLTIEQLHESLVTKSIEEIVTDRIYYIKHREVGLLYNIDTKE